MKLLNIARVSARSARPWSGVLRVVVSSVSERCQPLSASGASLCQRVVSDSVSEWFQPLSRPCAAPSPTRRAALVHVGATQDTLRVVAAMKQRSQLGQSSMEC
mmetsp:Transcript_58482/g.154209  ORF Transcript_58482/g.154209 Transcript_58482/m.154209 type:complete len:103 (+) Transcript_58482:1607-1915(+)